ncbi:hypothetical protein Aeh1ORF255c [Aeromonas phage Aeh1]|uniref:Uncharacterized protein n=1 Tax=Aeromonas phage Aeh1 TaxID=2880362 RepID=Q76YH7_9CAUD|nr:hypothetical protein Aeh1p268 [Aeromonas phage Aeh1]AAQ17918.1 hypothetical protein Aeh1ORF255c [Aeromonas phage Aeh1]
MSSEQIKIAVIGGGERIGMRAELIRVLSENEDLKQAFINLEVTEDEILDRIEEFRDAEREEKKMRIVISDSLASLDRLMYEPPMEFSCRLEPEVPFWAMHGNKRSVYKCHRR